MVAGVAEYAADVRAGVFPGPEHGYTIDPDELARFQAHLREARLREVAEDGSER
jgi:hypothetical protein